MKCLAQKYAIWNNSTVSSRFRPHVLSVFLCTVFETFPGTFNGVATLIRLNTLNFSCV